MQTAARGAVRVFAGCVRSSQGGGSKSVIADSTVARGGSSKRQGRISLQSDVGKLWEQNVWCLAKFGDFGILA